MHSAEEHLAKAEEWLEAANAPRATTGQVRACAAAAQAELMAAYYLAHGESPQDMEDIPRVSIRADGLHNDDA